MPWGHQFTEWFYAGEVDSLRARLHAAMTARLSRDELLQFREQVAVQPGNETEVLEEAVEPKGLYRTYRREVHMANAGETVPVVFWTINSARRIAGCFIRPKES